MPEVMPKAGTLLVGGETPLCVDSRAFLSRTGAAPMRSIPRTHGAASAIQFSSMALRHREQRNRSADRHEKSEPARATRLGNLSRATYAGVFAFRVADLRATVLRTVFFTPVFFPVVLRAATLRTAVFLRVPEAFFRTVFLALDDLRADVFLRAGAFLPADFLSAVFLRGAALRTVFLALVDLRVEVFLRVVFLVPAFLAVRFTAIRAQ